MAKKSTPPLKQTRRKKTIVILLITLAATILIVISVMTLMKPRHSLGNGMEYIGKSDNGCWLPLCASRPNTDYFYGTDIEIHDLEHYFAKASLQKSYNYTEGISANSNFKDVYFNEHSNYFIITYYDNKDTVINDFKLNSTSKKYVIHVNSEVYQSAKDSLSQP